MELTKQKEKLYWLNEWKKCKRVQPELCRQLEKEREEWFEKLKVKIEGKSIKEIADIKIKKFESIQDGLKINMLKLNDMNIF